MTISNYLFFIKKRLLSTKMNLCSIFVSSIGLFLFIIAIVIPSILTHGRKSILTCLDGNEDSYAVVELDSEAFFNQRKSLLKQIMESDRICSFGSWSYGVFDLASAEFAGNQYAELMLELHDSELKEFEKKGGHGLQCVYMNASAIKYNGIHLLNGKADVDQYLDHDLILLGYNYRDIPIGTIIKNNKGRVFEVVGILEKGTSIINSPSIFQDTDDLKLDYTTHMDNMILCLYPDLMNRGITSIANFVSFSDGYSYEDGKSELERIADIMGVKLTVERLMDRVDEVMLRTDWIYDKIIAAMIIFAVLSFVIILSVQLLVTLNRKTELGVLAANGIGHRGILKLIILENSIKMLMAYLAAYGAYIVVLKFGNIQKSTLYHLSGPLFVITGLSALLFCVFMIILISLITWFYIRRMSLTALINGNQ